MAIWFHVLTANGALTGALRDRLDVVLAETAQLCSEKLKLGNVDVVVMHAPHHVIPRIGVNGYSFDAHQIHLSLDAAHEHLRTHFATAIQAVLAHELHHCARSLALGSSHGDTYGGCLVAEGLACCFEEEIGAPTPFYATECGGEALRRFLEKVKPHLSMKRGELPGSWNDWMFGCSTDDDQFPYQCGYSTGYTIVRGWLDSTGCTASRATDVDEAEIIHEWLHK